MKLGVSSVLLSALLGVLLGVLRRDFAERLQVRRQSRCARALFFGRQMRESANLTHAAIRRASAAKRLGHVGLGRGVVEANLLTGSDRATGQQRSALNARIGIARVVQEAPRMSAAHLFVRQRVIGLDVHGFIELNGVARRARLQSSRDGEDARSACNIAGCEETHAVVEVEDRKRITGGIRRVRVRCGCGRGSCGRERCCDWHGSGSVKGASLQSMRSYL